MGFQQHGNREVGLSGIALGSKNEYKRMHSELPEGDDDVLQQEARRKSTRKYVIACATFASLNNVLLGYGMLDSLSLLLFFVIHERTSNIFNFGLEGTDFWFCFKTIAK